MGKFSINFFFNTYVYWWLCWLNHMWDKNFQSAHFVLLCKKSIAQNYISKSNNKFEIQLRPENLGKIHVTIEITGQNVDININSDNVNSIQSLTENNSNLQKMLQNNGMNLNNFNFNGNNNKGSNKDSKDSKVHKNENISVNTKDNNNDDDSFMSDKLVYAKA